MKEIILSTTEKIRLEYLIEYFDFKKVHNGMVLMNWVWAGSKSSDGIPSLQEIKNNAISLIKNVIVSCVREKKTGYIGSGGFEARYNYEWDRLELLFILSDMSDEYIDEEEAYIKALNSEKRKSKIKKLFNND